MARDDESDKSKRRWGRGGKPEEGPSEDELGWLADLRGARDTRAPLDDDPLTGPGTPRGRRPSRPAGDPAPGSPLPPPDPFAGDDGRPASPRGRRSSAPPPPPAPPPVVPPPPPAAPTSGDQPRTSRWGRRSQPTPPPAAAAGPPPAPPAPTRPARSERPERSERTSGFKAPTPPPERTGGFGPPERTDGFTAPRTGGLSAPERTGGFSAPERTGSERTGSERTGGFAAPERTGPERTGGFPAPERTGPERTGGFPAPERTGPERTGGFSVPERTGGFSVPERTGGFSIPERTGSLTRPAGPAGPAGPGPSGPGGGPGLVGPGPGGPGPAGARPAGPRPGPAPVDLVTTGMIKRAEIRKHLRIAQQLKVGTLALVAVLVLAAYPVYLFAREVAQDPVIGEFDSLDLPGWANLEHSDSASGNRWCVGKCRFRQRTWASERAPDETQNQYVTSLGDAGWRPRAEGSCAPIEDGQVTCWKRDEYVMDMWVRAPICDLPPPRPVTSASPGATPAAPPSPVGTCPGALVTMRVWNAIDYDTSTVAAK